MAGISAEIWESRSGGAISFGAYGPRDVMVIISSGTISSSPEAVSRNEGKLTAEDESRLTSEGIPPECWLDDLQLMTARFHKEKERFEMALVLNEPHLKREYVLRKISEVLIGSKKPGGNTSALVLEYFQAAMSHYSS